MNGNLIDWTTLEQKNVTLFSTTVELVALLIWVDNCSTQLAEILQEFGYRNLTPIKAFEDNQGVIIIVNNPSARPTAKSKNIDIWYNF